MKKNIFTRILAIALVAMSIMAITIPAMATPLYSGYFPGKVSTSSGALNVRDQPNTSSAINGTLAHNSTAHKFCAYYVDGSSSFAASWLMVYMNGNTNTAPLGFVKARYITWLPSYGVGTCFSTTVEVTEGQYVNLREKPTKNSTSIGKLHNNDVVLVLHTYDDPNNGWTHIATAQGTGWIMTNYLHTQG